MSNNPVEDAYNKGQSNITAEKGLGLGSDMLTNKKGTMYRLAKAYRRKFGHSGKAGRYYTKEDFEE